MRTLLAGLALLAWIDGGPSASSARRTSEVRNLGASAVRLLLQNEAGAYVWGPFELGPQEVLRISSCPCAGLTLELRSPVRKAALRYPLADLSALLLSEDRWSEGEPIVRREVPPPTCSGPPSCEGPPFRITR